MPVRLSLGGAVTAAVTPHEPGEGFALGIGERGAAMRLQEFVENDVRFTCIGLGRKAVFHRDGTVLDSHCLGRPWHIEDLTRKAVPRHVHAGSDGKLRASMNGRVVAVLAAVGAAVEAGRAMVTLEAMKMEHIHTAPVFGHVKVLHVGRPPTPRSGSALSRGEPTLVRVDQVADGSTLGKSRAQSPCILRQSVARPPGRRQAPVRGAAAV